MIFRNSSKVGRSRVTVRIAPAEPFSPFKRRISSESQGRGRRKDGEDEKRSSSTDPR